MLRFGSFILQLSSFPTSEVFLLLYLDLSLSLSFSLSLFLSLFLSLSLSLSLIPLSRSLRHDFFFIFSFILLDTVLLQKVRRKLGLLTTIPILFPFHFMVVSRAVSQLKAAKMSLDQVAGKVRFFCGDQIRLKIEALNRCCSFFFFFLIVFFFRFFFPF